MCSPLLSSYMFALSWPNYSTADDGYFLSLSVLLCSCVFVYLLFPACFGRLVSKALWETVCCALSRITKATEPLPSWSWHFRELYESVCVFMDLTSRWMLILQREICMKVFQEKTCMFRTPMSEAVTNSEESFIFSLSFRCWSISLLVFLSWTFITDLQCRGTALLCLLWTIAKGFSVASDGTFIYGSQMVLPHDPYFTRDIQWKSIMVLLLFIIWKKTQIFFLVFFL